MQVTIFAGKGGVGKSTIAAAFALHQSASGRSFMVDYDGGHSLTKVLALGEMAHPPNTITPSGTDNLDIAILDPMSFQPISEAQRAGVEVNEYLSQFSGDYGLIPFCDMVTSFFGAPTDVASVSRFASLIDVYHKAKGDGTRDIVIDVEPTAGLERLLSSVGAITRSIENLRDTNKLVMMAINAGWPDISAYLKSEYIRHAEVYAERLREITRALTSARYHIVTIPESSPVDEMADVQRVITSFGGETVGYVINNMRGEPHEQIQIQRVKDNANDRKVVKVKRDLRLCDSNPEGRIDALREVGSLF
ncbi:MAG: ArsA-related P-loop ATPase [Candidatus Woesearchaeota archaeon]